ncbi:RnfABCDGE type electron transport complex subunit D [Aquitalea magnusonii]|nr:RnfABCDGE type electron transport complex subunit D [Aquitalea magnusonii]
MMNTPVIRLAPTLASRNRQQLLALLPAIAIQLWQWGPPALLALASASASALLADSLGLAWRRQAIWPGLRQGEALLTAVLLSLLLPDAAVPLLCLCTGGAILLLRQLFGGSGSSLFHPVAGGLLLAAPWLPAGLPHADIPLSLALLAGGLWLLWRGLLRWQAPLGLLLVVLIALPVGSGWLLGQSALWLLAGWVMSDGSATPITPRGRLVYGQAAGMLCISFVTLTTQPDAGVTLAACLLLLSASAPLLDRLTLSPGPRT